MGKYARITSILPFILLLGCSTAAQIEGERLLAADKKSNDQTVSCRKGVDAKAEFASVINKLPEDPENPIAYPPAELIFPPGEEFWHTDVKWDYNVPFDFKEVTDPALTARLQDIAIRMYKAIGGVAYGRCDIRMNDQGELFVLEINPNPAIMLKPEEYGPADYMILYDEGGYKLFFERIIEMALLRHRVKMAEK